MEANDTARGATAWARRPETMGGAALVFVFLVGALLPIQQRYDMMGSSVNFCAADLVIVPAALLLGRRCLHTGKLGWWVFALWSVNLLAWVGSLSLLSGQIFVREAAKIATCYLFAVVGYGIGTTQQGERTLVKGMMFASIPIAAIALQAFVTHVPESFIPDGRVTGSFTDPNAFACFLALLITLVMSLRVDLLAIPLFIGAGVVTFSRTGLAGIAVALLLGATHARMRRYLPVLVLAVVGAGAVFVWTTTTVGSSLGGRVMDYGDTLDTRVMLWNRALEVVSAHPVIGIGRGAWDAISGVSNIPHNTLLSVAADTGLIGLAIFLLPLLLWLGRGMWRRPTRPWAIVLFINLLGGMAVSFDNYRPFWLATGVLVAQLAAYERSRSAQLAARDEAAQLTPVAVAG
jgi:O-antigen ligase